ncbi:MAG TPA: hypothetical protein VK772_10030 [Puia sp.]|nr:hypothetical protein [Puia sp.]
MGRQRDSKLVGTFGNVIFYNRLGEYCMRTKPTAVKRTKSTMHSGLNFGKASSICRQIRNLVSNINPVKSDQRLMYKLTGSLNKFISWKEKIERMSHSMPKTLPFIYGFQFNSEADLSSIRAIQPIIKSSNNGVVEINFAPFIPSQSLHAPSVTNYILFKMILVRSDLEKAEANLLGKSDLEIPFTNDSFQPAVINIPGDINPDDLVMLIISVQYMINRNGDIQMLSDKKRLPCGIAWAGML